MRIGLDIAQHQLEWPELARRARLADDAGFDGIWVFDHFKPLYGDPGGPCLEGWTALAALAAVTTRARLGTLVTGMTYRHPSVLAAEAVTVDHVSGGRLELAVGAAWFEEEHRQLGIPFPPTGERLDRLEEGIEVIRLLMTTDGATYDGTHYQLRQATYRPRPVQEPHPPIWVGGGGERRTLPMVGRLADAWHTFGPVQEMARKSRLVDEHAGRAGRDPSAILRSASLSLSDPWDDVRRTAESFRHAGFGYLVAGWPSEGEGRVAEFCEQVLPELAAA